MGGYCIYDLQYIKYSKLKFKKRVWKNLKHGDNSVLTKPALCEIKIIFQTGLSSLTPPKSIFCPMFTNRCGGKLVTIFAKLAETIVVPGSNPTSEKIYVQLCAKHVSLYCTV